MNNPKQPVHTIAPLQDEPHDLVEESASRSLTQDTITENHSIGLLNQNQNTIKISRGIIINFIQEEYQDMTSHINHYIHDQAKKQFSRPAILNYILSLFSYLFSFIFKTKINKQIALLSIKIPQSSGINPKDHAAFIEQTEELLKLKIEYEVIKKYIELIMNKPWNKPNCFKKSAYLHKYHIRLNEKIKTLFDKVKQFKETQTFQDITIIFHSNTTYEIVQDQANETTSSSFLMMSPLEQNISTLYEISQNNSENNEKHTENSNGPTTEESIMLRNIVDFIGGSWAQNAQDTIKTLTGNIANYNPGPSINTLLESAAHIHNKQVIYKIEKLIQNCEYIIELLKKEAITNEGTITPDSNTILKYTEDSIMYKLCCLKILLLPAYRGPGDDIPEEIKDYLLSYNNICIMSIYNHDYSPPHTPHTPCTAKTYHNDNIAPLFDTDKNKVHAACTSLTIDSIMLLIAMYHNISTQFDLTSNEIINRCVYLCKTRNLTKESNNLKQAFSVINEVRSTMQELLSITDAQKISQSFVRVFKEWDKTAKEPIDQHNTIHKKANAVDSNKQHKIPSEIPSEKNIEINSHVNIEPFMSQKKEI